jgi:branched-chain amino acid transport system permease protein
MTVPTYVGSSYYLGITAAIATRVMLLLGLSLLLGQAGQISLGQMGFAGIGAYGAAILTTRVGINAWLAVLLAALMAAVIAGLVGIPTLRLRGYYLAIATLGVNEIIVILITQLKSLTQGTDGISGIPGLSIGGLDLGTPRGFHFVVWVVALVMFRLALNLSNSRVGRSLAALRQSERAAESLGIGTSYRKVQIFVVAAVFASIAGSLDAYRIHFISPDAYTIMYSILVISGVIIGGLRSMWGAVWGAIVLVALNEVLTRIGLEDWVNLVFGALMILIMLVLQKGPKMIWRTLRGWVSEHMGSGAARSGSEG